MEDKLAMEVIELLTSPGEKLKIVSVVGMPGLGKTKLANSVYNHALMNTRFGIRAWCFASQTYKKQDLLSEILSQIGGSSSEDSIIDPAPEVYRSLKGRRYLIVIDDVWDTDLWNSLEQIIPDDCKGSRILLTTRHRAVALEANSICYPLRLLSNEESYQLLMSMVFDVGEACNQDMCAILRRVARTCNGLPLAIVLIAGILKTTERKKDSWELVSESVLDLHQKRGKSSGLDGMVHLTDVLSLSYEHLPEYLKPCFLYFGAVPKVSTISVSMLIRLWISEGFVVEEDVNVRLEEKSKDYLNELVDRSLVTVYRTSSQNGAKICQVHDVLRHFCLSTLEEHNILSRQQAFGGILYLRCNLERQVHSCFYLYRPDGANYGASRPPQHPLANSAGPFSLGDPQPRIHESSLTAHLKAPVGKYYLTVQPEFPLIHVGEYCFTAQPGFPLIHVGESYLTSVSRLPLIRVGKCYFTSQPEFPAIHVVESCLTQPEESSLNAHGQPLAIGGGSTSTELYQRTSRPLPLPPGDFGASNYTTGRFPHGFSGPSTHSPQPLPPGFFGAANYTTGRLPQPLPQGRSALLPLVCTSVGQVNMPPRESYYSFVLKYKQLGVLDLGNVRLESSASPSDFVMIATSLVDLTYLALRLRGNEIPAEISSLQKLQTLVLKGVIYWHHIYVPESFGKLLCLRYLLTDHGLFTFEHCSQQFFDNFPRMDNIKSISNLVLHPGSNVEKYMLKMLPGLQKLGCRFVADLWDFSLGYSIFPELHFLSELKSLEIFFSRKVRCPCIYSFPMNLTKLCMSNSRLPWDQMSVIAQLLPNLEALKLLSKAFQGEKWDTGAVEDQFLKLKFLKLESLDIMRWDVDDADHFPSLEQLVVLHCKRLQEIPYAIGEIPTLKLIEMKWCSPSASASATQILQLQRDFSNLDLNLTLVMSSLEPVVEEATKQEEKNIIQGGAAEVEVPWTSLYHKYRIFKIIEGLLKKLTPNNLAQKKFDTLTDQIIDSGITSAVILKVVSLLMYSNLSSIYANVGLIDKAEKTLLELEKKNNRKDVITYEFNSITASVNFNFLHGVDTPNLDEHSRVAHSFSTQAAQDSAELSFEYKN